MGNESHDHHFFLIVHSLLLDKQHIKIWEKTALDRTVTFRDE